MASVSSLDSLYRKVLSQGNKEQNAAYPPHIFSEHYNIVTNFIIDTCVKTYPDTTLVGDILRPFIESKVIPVIKGVAAFKEDYRDRLALKHFVTSDYKKNCNCDEGKYENDPLEDSQEKKDRKAEAGTCVWNDIEVLDVSEFGERTRHDYKYPTLEDAIATIKKGSEIKVCPFDIPHVEITYVRKPKIYVYGYKELPDHTFIFDSSKTEESEWDDAAFPYLLKGMNTLYSLYTRNVEMQNFNDALKKLGMF